MDGETPDGAGLLLEQVGAALAARRPLRIRGGDSKRFLGRPVAGEAIDTRVHRGIVHYDHTELVITARAGTPLSEIYDVLDRAGQMLPCEPPEFGGAGTVGGMVASGLSGPRRPWSSAVRDLVLGCRLITGHGRHLRFGGEVMKNVAGYDVSRLVAGSFGCLGLITEVSLKVLPKPRASRSLALAMPLDEALRKLAGWRRTGLPLAGACHDGDVLRLRLEGGEAHVEAAGASLGGERLDPAFWGDLRDHRLAFFADPRPLWRLSLPPLAPVLPLPGAVLADWGGAQRWLKSDAGAAAIRDVVEKAGGHATCFTALAADEPFHPLPAALLRYHKALKERMDPRGIFNPGLMNAQF